MLLDAYRYDGDRVAFAAAVAGRAGLTAAATEGLARAGNPIYTAMQPAVTDLEQAAREVETLPPSFWAP